MTNSRSDSRAKPTEPAHVVRLVDAKSSRKEASPPDDGIRPTREGRWDPCRFQEYELSPEFRIQVMTAKPPPADPKLFAETFPPTKVADILTPEADPLGDRPGQPPSVSAGAPSTRPTVTKPAREPQSRFTNGIKLLVFVGVALGLIGAVLAARAVWRPAVETNDAVLLLPAYSGVSKAAVPGPLNMQVAAPKQTVAPAPTSAALADGAPKASTRASKHSPLAISTMRSDSDSKKIKHRTASKPKDDLEPAWVEPK